MFVSGLNEGQARTGMPGFAGFVLWSFVALEREGWCKLGKIRNGPKAFLLKNFNAWLLARPCPGRKEKQAR
jgi:hypothetical protein